jgi:hypothetical protein
MASVSLSGLWLSQQVWQLRNIRRDPPRLTRNRVTFETNIRPTPGAKRIRNRNRNQNMRPAVVQ